MRSGSLKVLAVASEVFPLIKTGGLADVTGALPGALAKRGIAVTTLVPGYPAVVAALANPSAALPVPDLFGGPATVLRGSAAGLDLLVLAAPHLYDRPGNPYLGPEGHDWPDNAIRFAALGAVAAMIGRGAISGYQPAVLHAHDWQAGLTAAYLAFGGPNPPPSVMTVHNLAFQGQFPASLLQTLGFPQSAFRYDAIEHHGMIGYLKAGLQLSTHVTTVSPTYADEIRTPHAGMGLDGLLRYRGEAMSGILNGIDTDVWNPADDPLIARAYDPSHLKRKSGNKAALQMRLGLATEPAAPLFGVISRLSWQKGLDLLPAVVPHLIASGAQLAVLGSGDRELEASFRAQAGTFAGKVACTIGYDEALAHQIQAGCDFLVVPSRFEPCGLTQLCALRYGTVPVVSRVGGLADTVEDGRTGIVFTEVDTAGLTRALDRAVALYHTPRAFRRLARNGMVRDVSWDAPAQAYARLYRALARPTPI